MNSQLPSRRNLLKGVGGLSAGVALASGGMLAGASAARAAGPARSPGDLSGHGLAVLEANEDDHRMWYYRFATEAIGWDPMVNVYVPEGYRDSGRRYPVLYLLHGGSADFMTWDVEYGIRDLVANREVIVVMPDGGDAGWYSNPVSSHVGPRNWETFHMAQLVPWVDATFRTHGEFAGRAVAGFSMGGFGAMKYAAKYYGHFSSVSCHSGPTSMRRDAGAVTHWANATSAVAELGGGMVYGTPWDEGRVSADNPMENLERYRDKRVFLVCGDSPHPLDWWSQINEWQVLAGQREFRAALDDVGIAHDSHEDSGGHYPRDNFWTTDLDGIVAHLRPAG